MPCFLSARVFQNRNLKLFLGGASSSRQGLIFILVGCGDKSLSSMNPCLMKLIFSLVGRGGHVVERQVVLAFLGLAFGYLGAEIGNALLYRVAGLDLN